MAINPEDLIDPIRYYKPNDPYYYEVDNLPLEDLLENDRRLLQAITSIVASIPNDLQGGDRFATERWVSDVATGPFKRVLADLDDVSTDDPTEKQVLTYSTAGWEPQTPATFLDDLEDVQAHAGGGAAPNRGSILQFDGSNWKNLFGTEPSEGSTLRYSRSNGFWETTEDKPERTVFLPSRTKLATWANGTAFGSGGIFPGWLALPSTIPSNAISVVITTNNAEDFKVNANHTTGFTGTGGSKGTLWFNFTTPSPGVSYIYGSAEVEIPLAPGQTHLYFPMTDTSDDKSGQIYINSYKV